MTTTNDGATTRLTYRERCSPWVRLQLSEEAFCRMLQGAPRNRELAERWNAHISRLAPRAEELRDNAAFRATYDAVIDATTVPSKARAIRAHLAKWDSLATELYAQAQEGES